jgi:hypothetical protein
VICPSGGFSQTRLWPFVQPPIQKYFCFSETQIRCISRPIPRSLGGALRIVMTLGAGCGGRDWLRATNAAGCGRRSRVVLTPRRWRQVFAGVTFRRRRWQKSPVTGESAKETVKSIAQGMSVRDVPVVTLLVCFPNFAREAMGAGCAPGIPCALCLLEGMLHASIRAHWRGEDAEACQQPRHRQSLPVVRA